MPLTHPINWPENDGQRRTQISWPLALRMLADAAAVIVDGEAVLFHSEDQDEQTLDLRWEDDDGNLFEYAFGEDTQVHVNHITNQMELRAEEGDIDLTLLEPTKLLPNQ